MKQRLHLTQRPPCGWNRGQAAPQRRDGCQERDRIVPADHSPVIEIHPPSVKTNAGRTGGHVCQRTVPRHHNNAWKSNLRNSPRLLILQKLNCGLLPRLNSSASGEPAEMIPPACMLKLLIKSQMGSSRSRRSSSSLLPQKVCRNHARSQRSGRPRRIRIPEKSERKTSESGCG